MSQTDIINELESQIKRVDTQSLDISFNELFDMYTSGELDITPDYQRLFRWSEGTRSRFIESLLLQMPVPPIYVIETEEGKYELIDGLQRFSSYLHLRGELEAEHLDSPINKGDLLKLTECDIVNSLNGLTWNDLPTILQIKLKRTYIRVQVVKKTSDNVFKYHMFKRLNTGGEVLSYQQIRNCTIRLLNTRFINYIENLKEDNNFRTCIANISETQRLEAFDQELVLRFFALKNNPDNFSHDVADFFTEYMEKVTTEDISFDYEDNQSSFEKTFNILNQTWGDRIFGRLNKSNDDLQSNFGIYHFESITLGLQSILNKVNENEPEHINKIKKIILALKQDEEFKKRTTGGGKNSSGQFKARIAISEKYFQQIEF
ncbi:DUF262 domain-containing protein [Gilliamella apicola]|uniref:DUF262 domain-containing protein n=1 Tax=Gilliamella apicola TaxID=1196095 RepID=UPI002FEE5F64